MSEKAMTIGLSHGGVMNPANVGEAIEMAKMIAASGMVPKQYEGNPGSVLVAIQMGAELGLQPMQAIQNIAVINGRPSLWGDAMLALVTSHPDCQDVTEWAEGGDGETAVAYCKVTRRGRSAVQRSFSVTDAKTAGLWKKPGPWTQYPKRMMQLRARGFALRDSFPDVLRGIQTTEENLDIVEQEFVEAKQAEAANPLAPGRHAINPPKPEPEPEPEPVVVEAKPEPESESVQVAKERIAAAEKELLDAMSRVETKSEIGVMTRALAEAKLSKGARGRVWQAIKKREAEIVAKDATND